jgi:hypothetical protein
MLAPTIGERSELDALYVTTAVLRSSKPVQIP